MQRQWGIFSSMWSPRRPACTIDDSLSIPLVTSAPVVVDPSLLDSDLGDAPTPDIRAPQPDPVENQEVQVGIANLLRNLTHTDEHIRMMAILSLADLTESDEDCCDVLSQMDNAYRVLDFVDHARPDIKDKAIRLLQSLLRREPNILFQCITALPSYLKDKRFEIAKFIVDEISATEIALDDVLLTTLHEKGEQWIPVFLPLLEMSSPEIVCYAAAVLNFLAINNEESRRLILDSNGDSLLIKQLLQRLTDYNEERSRFLWLALVALTKDSEDVLERIADGVLSVIVGMRKYKKNPTPSLHKEQQEASSAQHFELGVRLYLTMIEKAPLPLKDRLRRDFSHYMLNACCSPGVGLREIIFDEGWLAPIVEMLKSKDTFSCLVPAETIGAFAYGVPKYAEAAVTLGALPLLVPLLSSYPSNYFADALCCLAQTTPIFEEIIALLSSALPSLTSEQRRDMLRKFEFKERFDPSMPAKIFSRLLVETTGDIWADVAFSFCQRTASSSGVLYEYGCEPRPYNYSSIVAELGLTPILLSLLTNESEELKGKAVQALATFVIAKPSNGQIVCALGGIPLLINLLRQEIERPRYKDLFKVFISLFTHSEGCRLFREALGVPLMLSVLTDKDAERRQEAIIALSTLVRSDPLSWRQIQEMGGIPLLITLLENQNKQVYGPDTMESIGSIIFDVKIDHDWYTERALTPPITMLLHLVADLEEPERKAEAVTLFLSFLRKKNSIIQQLVLKIITEYVLDTLPTARGFLFDLAREAPREMRLLMNKACAPIIERSFPSSKTAILFFPRCETETAPLSLFHSLEHVNPQVRHAAVTTLANLEQDPEYLDAVSVARRDAEMGPLVSALPR